MAGPIASAIQGKYNKEAAKEAAKLAAKQQKAGIQLINEMDFEPMYASSRVPTFQRSQSPVARSYIDSFLMGNNPDSVRSTAPNAALQKGLLQKKQNAMFGTPEARLAEQRQIQAATPWAVRPPERTIKSTFTPEAQFTAQNSELAQSGINGELEAALRETGTDLPKQLTSRDRKGGDLGAAMQSTWATAAIEKLLKEQYNGDATRLAADIRAAGGLKPLTKKKGR